MQNVSGIKDIIESAWEKLNDISHVNRPELKEAVENVLDLLDNGIVRVSEKIDGLWVVNEWIKKAILLYFRIKDPEIMNFGFSDAEAGKACWFDKVELKFDKWDLRRFQESKIRVVPGCFVRKSAYIAPNVVLMPSFVNMGAYVDEGSMVDSWVTIGSCAQIGKNCHISGGVGIGGVLEPLQGKPVIIEDNCFIGARSEVAEGVVVREGAVLAMGVYIGSSTKIIDRSTGKVYQGEVPPYSVVVPGSHAFSTGHESNVSLYCAVIVKKVDQQTRSKTSINEILRNISE